MERVPPCEPAEIVARLCHQVRNPLATIQSGVQLVQVLASPTGEAADCLKTVLGEVGRIDAMLRDANRIVRLAPGPPLRVDLAQLASQAAIGHGSGAIEVDALVPDGPTELWMETSPELLLIALNELLGRAVRVTPEGGAVHLRWGEHGTDGVTLEVDDGGACFAAEGRERTLRAVAATWPGSGLGLCLVERACALLGGHLDWTGLSPQGCRFRITLPRG